MRFWKVNLRVKKSVINLCAFVRVGRFITCDLLFQDSFMYCAYQPYYVHAFIFSVMSVSHIVQLGIFQHSEAGLEYPTSGFWHTEFVSTLVNPKSVILVAWLSLMEEHGKGFSLKG